MNATEPSQQEKVRDILSGFDTGVLVTHASNGRLRARPMAIAQVAEDCCIWFLTGHECAKVHEIEEDTRVTVICQKDHTAYLSIGGFATLENDRAKVSELWKESYKTWFPKGKDDPDLVLIRVHPEEAEYWDQRGVNGLRYLFESAKAYATGTTPEIKEGEQHGRVQL